jgi:hypothetical protein
VIAVQTLYPLLAALLLPEGSPPLLLSDPVELGHHLELALAALQPLDGDSEVQDEMADFVGLDLEVLESLQVYSAQATPKAGRAQPMRVAVLSLAADVASAFLALAVRENGSVASAAVFGSPTFDGDALAWRFYCEQFTRPGKLAAVLDSLETADQLEVEDRVAELGAAEKSLYRLRQQMLANGYYSTQVFALTNKGDQPSAALLKNWQSNFQALHDSAEGLSAFLGSEALPAFREAARAGRQHVERAGQAYAETKAEAAQQALAKINEVSCNRCHSIRSDALGPRQTIYNSLLGKLDSLGARTDLAQVGLDVWAVPGQEELSQKIALRAKAILLVLGAMQD